jgi:hypothetical protein
MLCVPCFESLLGRELTISDFTAVVPRCLKGRQLLLKLECGQ